MIRALLKRFQRPPRRSAALHFDASLESTRATLKLAAETPIPTITWSFPDRKPTVGLEFPNGLRVTAPIPNRILAEIRNPET